MDPKVQDYVMSVRQGIDHNGVSIINEHFEVDCI